MNTRKGIVSTLCFVLLLAYSRFITIISAIIHGKSMVKTFAQTLAFVPTADNQDKKFSLLKSIEKYVVALTLKLSKSDGRITVHSITFE